jgi:hypothetical protein
MALSDIDYLGDIPIDLAYLSYTITSPLRRLKPFQDMECFYTGDMKKECLRIQGI